MSQIFEELERRGLIAQMTHPEKIKELLNEGGAVFYMGTDATASSLHVGHYLMLSVIKRMQLAGHKPILLLGTGTTMVGDPSGRTDMRPMLTVEEINRNADAFVEQMGRIINLEDAIIERNGDWLMHLNYIQLLREVGVHFSVNEMLGADCFKVRMEKGLSFLEFNYMIMQSYDFLHLFRQHNCVLQFGGNDQWSNIIHGVDLIRRVEGKEAYGMTFTLLATKGGTKMGKTQGGAVWLDAEKTSPYEFFQYWRNVSDEDVINRLKMLTFVPIDEIEAMEAWEGSQLNKAKEILAFELTKDIHGREEAEKALAAAQAIFVAGGQDENMPTTNLTAQDLEDGSIAVVDLLVRTGLASSKSEARRLIQGGGVSVDDDKVNDQNHRLNQADLTQGVILKKGKKVFHKVTL